MKKGYTMQYIETIPVSTRSFEVRKTSSNPLPQLTSMGWMFPSDTRKGIKDKNLSNALCRFTTYSKEKIVTKLLYICRLKKY